MKDAVEVEFATVGLIAERGISEPDIPVLADNDIVRRVQSFAFEFRREHLRVALLVDADHLPCSSFTHVNTALAIKSGACGSGEAVFEDLRLPAGHPLDEVVG